LRGFRIPLLLLISFLVLLNGWIYLVWTSLENTVLDGGYYKRLIEETDLVLTVHQEAQRNLPQVLPGLISEEIYMEMDEAYIAEEGLDEETIREERWSFWRSNLNSVFSFVLVPGWVEHHVELLIEDFLAYFKAEQVEETDVIDLTSFKEDFRQRLLFELEVQPEESLRRIGLDLEDLDLVAEQVTFDILPADEVSSAALLEGGLIVPAAPIAASDSRVDATRLLEEGLIPSGANETVNALSELRKTVLLWSPILFASLLILALLIAGIGNGLVWFGAAVSFFSFTGLLGFQFMRAMFSLLFLAVTEFNFGLIEVSSSLLQTAVGNAVSAASITPLVFLVVGVLLVAGGLTVGNFTKRSNSRK